MDTKSELKIFISHFVSDQSPDILEAIELNSFNQINVEKLLLLGVSENYVFRLKDAWKAWYLRANLNKSSCGHEDVHAKGFYRMSQLATTAPRKGVKYITGDGKVKLSKSRPARKGLLPMGETTIRKLISAGKFPTPIKMGRATAWRIEDIEEWMVQQGMKAES
ncbi:helix-turn-helix transcriptional regulator [Acinetobacter lwoffii]|uniref:helix-turn-helix transcriptional regulator n=1 Tax=Acinetobacter lwoffii TaxID=28090 RepID=UPI003BF68D59